MTPEATLWLAVVVQTLTDAVTPPRRVPRITRAGAKRPQNEIKYVTQQRLRVRDEARAWLTENSLDFRRVCSLAELESDDIHEKCLKLAALGWPEPPILTFLRRKLSKGAWTDEVGDGANGRSRAA